MMRRNRFLAVAGVVSFVLFAISNLPASIVTNQLGEIARTGGVGGTLWSGSVRTLDINGWRLSDTRWSMNPAALLLGRLSANVSTRVAGGEISTGASISAFGGISFRDLEATGPLAPIAQKFNQPLTGGRYEIELSELDVADTWPSSLVGSGRITDVPLNIGGNVGVTTGSYSVVFDTETVPEDGRLSGILTDDGGPVEVEGNIFLEPPTNYQVQARLKPRPGAPVQISQALKLVGPIDANGRHEISFAGSL